MLQMQMDVLGIYLGAGADFVIEVADEVYSVIDGVIFAVELKGIASGGNAHAEALFNQLEVFVQLPTQRGQ